MTKLFASVWQKTVAALMDAWIMMLPLSLIFFLGISYQDFILNGADPYTRFCSNWLPLTPFSYERWMSSICSSLVNAYISALLPLFAPLLLGDINRGLNGTYIGTLAATWTSLFAYRALKRSCPARLTIVQRLLGSANSPRQVNRLSPSKILFEQHARKIISAILVTTVFAIAAEYFYAKFLDEKVTQLQICLIPDDDKHTDILVHAWGHLAELYVSRLHGDQRTDFLRTLADLCRKAYGPADVRYLSLLILMLNEGATNNVESLRRNELICDELLTGTAAIPPGTIGSLGSLASIGFLHPEGFEYAMFGSYRPIDYHDLDRRIALSFACNASTARRMHRYDLAARYYQKSLVLCTNALARTTYTNPEDDREIYGWEQIFDQTRSIAKLPGAAKTTSAIYENIFRLCHPHNRFAKKICNKMHEDYYRVRALANLQDCLEHSRNPHGQLR